MERRAETRRFRERARARITKTKHEREPIQKAVFWNPVKGRMEERRALPCEVPEKREKTRSDADPRVNKRRPRSKTGRQESMSVTREVHV
jgi:hypothetical protein